MSDEMPFAADPVLGSSFEPPDTVFVALNPYTDDWLMMTPLDPVSGLEVIALLAATEADTCLRSAIELMKDRYDCEEVMAILLMAIPYDSAREIVKSRDDGANAIFLVDQDRWGVFFVA